MLLYLTWVVALAVSAFFYLRKLYTTFSRAGVSHLPPVPLLGNMAAVALRKEHMTAYFQRIYNKFSSTDRFAGTYELLRPSVLLLDTELVKAVTVKDFDYFVNHRKLVDGDVDPMFGKNVFHMEGQEWRDMRSTLSPAFTSSKMKLMVPFMEDVGNQMVKNLKQKIANSGGHVDINITELTSRCTNDVIASCAFGVKVDSNKDENNHFYKMGRLASYLGFRESMILFGYGSIPNIMKLLNIPLIKKQASSFLKNLVFSTMKTREEKKIVRNDMIHLLMEAKKGKLAHENNAANETDVGFAVVKESAVGRNTIQKNWSDDELISQGVGFFIAGFETVSTGISWLLYELAVNPDIQERLYQEIMDSYAKHGGKLDFKALQEIKYLDMVVSEVLRKWPPAILGDRICSKDYNIGKSSEKSKKDYIIRKGDSVTIPIWCFHRDPRYFPEPQKFDPERFSDENKHKIDPFAYMPFGSGPRNCIGSRFALIEMKVLTCMMLQHLKLSTCEKTNLTEEMDHGAVFNLRLKGGFWVRFMQRN